MLDSFDLIKMQNLLNLKSQEIRNEILKEVKSIDEDLVQHINDNFTSRTKGIKNPEESKKIYSIQDHANKKYIRNSKCWAYDLDLTCISPWNSTGNNTRAGTAITKYHIIFAKHYPINVGSTVRFITKNNELVERKLTNTSFINGTDIMLGLLDEKLPDTIKPAKILPKFYRDYLAIDYNLIIDMNNGMLTRRFPVLCLDAEEKAIINELNAISGNKEIACKKASGELEKFSENIILGDSGNPCFTIIDNEPVLLTTWLSGGWGCGPFVSGDTWINSEKTLKSNLREIQMKLYEELLFNNDGRLLTEMLLNYVDLWRFRKVSP